MQFGLLRRVVKEIVHEVASKVPEKDAAKPKQAPRGPTLHNSISRGQPEMNRILRSDAVATAQCSP